MREKTVDEILKYMRDLEFMVCGHCGKCTSNIDCEIAFATIARNIVEAHETPGK